MNLIVALMLIAGVGVNDGVGKDHPIYGGRLLLDSKHVYLDTSVIHRPKMDVGDGWALEERAFVGDQFLVGVLFRYQHTSLYGKLFLFPAWMVRFEHFDFYMHGPEAFSKGSRWGAGWEFYTGAGDYLVRFGAGYTELNDSWYANASIGVRL